jgi:hypothetical protein
LSDNGTLGDTVRLAGSWSIADALAAFEVRPADPAETPEVMRITPIGLLGVAKFQSPLPLFGRATTELARAGLQNAQPSLCNLSNLDSPHGPTMPPNRVKHTYFREEPETCSIPLS